MFATKQIALAEKILDTCKDFGLMIATAESCTGGLIAACLTEVAGASEVFDRGFVTYHNCAKNALLGVSKELLNSKGAVSEEVAKTMAEGALFASQAGLAISCTGIAGPGGGTLNKPVGLIHMACAITDKSTVAIHRNYGNLGRASLRQAALTDSLQLALNQLETQKN